MVSVIRNRPRKRGKTILRPPLLRAFGLILVKGSLADAQQVLEIDFEAGRRMPTVPLTPPFPIPLLRVPHTAIRLPTRSVATSLAHLDCRKALTLIVAGPMELSLTRRLRFLNLGRGERSWSRAFGAGRHDSWWAESVRWTFGPGAQILRKTPRT